jgi:hypothetical protein
MKVKKTLIVSRELPLVSGMGIVTEDLVVN